MPHGKTSSRRSLHDLTVLRITADEKVMTRSEIEEGCKEFHTDLFASKASARKMALQPQEGEHPSLMISEVCHAAMPL